MSENKCNELNRVSLPLVEFLRENFNPHCQIVIGFDGVRVVEDVLSVPYKEKTHSANE